MSVFNNILSLASALVDRVTIGLNATGTLFLLVLVMVVNTDVVARGIFNSPLKGAVEIIEFSMVLIVFLQLPDVVRVNRLTRSDGFLAILASHNPGRARHLCRLIDAVSATLMALVVITMWPEFLDTWETGEFFGTPGIFTAPYWPVKLAIVVGGAFCSLRWSLNVLQGRMPPHLENIAAAEGQTADNNNNRQGD